MLTTPRQPLTLSERTVEPGRGEVLLRMEACGLCHSDLMIAFLEALPRLPLVLGHEGIGRVERLGEGVTGLSIGDRVGVTYLAESCLQCELCRAGLERFCAKAMHHGYTRDGAMATFVVAAAQQLVKVPESLDAAVAAPLCCAGWTAYSAVKGTKLEPGRKVALFGLGGLGHLAVQYARHAALSAAACDVSEAKLEQARKLGAERALLSVGAGRELQKSWGGVDAALVFTASAQAIQEAFRAVKRTGEVVLVGMGGGARYDLPLNDTILRGVRIRGSFLGSRAELEEVFRLALEGVGVPHVQRHRLEDVPELIYRLRDGMVMGRAVVTMDGSS